MERLSYLFKRFTDKTASYQERLEFQQLLATEDYDDALKAMIQDFWQAGLVTQEPLGITPEEMMLSQIMEKAAIKSNQISSRIKLWGKISIAASISIIIVLGGYFYQKESKKTIHANYACLLYTSPSPRDQRGSRMPSSA